MIDGDRQPDRTGYVVEFHSTGETGYVWPRAGGPGIGVVVLLDRDGQPAAVAQLPTLLQRVDVSDRSATSLRHAWDLWAACRPPVRR